MLIVIYIEKTKKIKFRKLRCFLSRHVFFNLTKNNEHNHENLFCTKDIVPYTLRSLDKHTNERKEVFPKRDFFDLFSELEEKQVVYLLEVKQNFEESQNEQKMEPHVKNKKNGTTH
jgi:hypothetical protein